MAIRWKINCAECDKKDSFEDAKSINYSKWRIIGWILPSGEPLCVCEKCEYGDRNKKLKINK